MGRILKIAGTIFALAMLIIIFSTARSLDNEKIPYSEERTTLSNLEAKRIRIKNRQQDRISELEMESKGYGHLMLLFTEPGAQIYSDIYQISGDTPCNLLINLSDLPGKDGNLTWDEVHALLDAGWGLCLNWDGDSDLSQWHDQMQQILIDFELPQVSSVYLTEQCYTDEIKDTLYSLGYHTIIQRRETGDLSCVSLQEDIFLPGAVGWFAQNSGSMPKTLAYNGGSLVFTIGFTYDDEIYNPARFQNLMNRISYYHELAQLSACSIESAYEYYEKLTNETFDISSDAAFIALQEELDAIDKQISELKEIIQQSSADN